MYKASKSKIVMTIILTLVLFLATTLVAIYISTYISVQKKNAEMLRLYVTTYWEKGNPEGNLQKLMPELNSSEKNKLRYTLSFFYSVAFSADGAVIAVDNEMQDILSDDYFVDLGRTLSHSGKNFGTTGEWMYHIERKGGITLVAFKNNQTLDDDMRTLIINTVLIGLVAILLLIGPSIYLAHRIVEPLESSYIKQKQFITNASHDLKTPLTVILTNTEMLETEIGDNKWLGYIKYEAQLMNRLVNQLFALTRSEQAKHPYQVMNLSRVVLGSALPFETLGFEKEKRLELDIEEKLFILGDEDQIPILVGILLDNALEYGTIGKNIQLNLRGDRQHIYLTITNECPPFTAIELERLFDRFYRLDSSRTDSSHFGLGLSIAKGIVNQHQGKISAAYEQHRLEICVKLQRTSQ